MVRSLTFDVRYQFSTRMVDHHHHVRALWESDIKFAKKMVYFYILEDLSQ